MHCVTRAAKNLNSLFPSKVLKPTAVPSFAVPRILHFPASSRPVALRSARLIPFRKKSDVTRSTDSKTTSLVNKQLGFPWLPIKPSILTSSLPTRKLTFPSLFRHEKTILRNLSTKPIDVENPKTELQIKQQIMDFSRLGLQTLPNFVSKEKLETVKKWIDTMMDVAYEDFDNRIGITWDDYWVNSDFHPKLLSIDPIKKFVNIQGKNVEQFPQSIFRYPKISHILLHDILPSYFFALSKQTMLPPRIYLQTFVLRSPLAKGISTEKQHVRWHQDPSDYGNTIADYTLVWMLSDPFDPSSGWEGGELLIKNGLPTDESPAARVTPKYNQAILFNNKHNSHLVTAITNTKKVTHRDIVIINVYLDDPSSPK